MTTASPELRVALLQTNLHWEDKAANLRDLEQKMRSLAQPLDLIVLPEMFSTGFSMRPQTLAETMQGETIQWLTQLAKDLNTAICGSLIIEAAAGDYRNRFVFLSPSGDIQHYDKRHLFGMANEGKHYTAGDTQTRIHYKGWRIAPFVCYDLRFPVWSRNTDDYDLAIYVANWPHRRSAHWRILLQARAVENQAYILGVNRVGNDGNGIYHSGYSAIIDPEGKYLCELVGEDTSQIATLSQTALADIRKRLPFLQDRD
jgi:predicted amidohydrolase